MLCPGLEQQSCGKSHFLFMRGDVRKDGEPEACVLALESIGDW